MARYDGKNVVIIGGSSGIGLGTAQLLADGGARVLITGRNRATLDAAGEKTGAITVQSDVSVLPEIDALADRVKAEFGTVDALFVNAGVSGFAPLEGTTEAMYDKLFAINAKGPYFTVQKLAPLLAEGSGVVLTTSVANVIGMAGAGVYSATKAALRSMTRVMARELLPRGVRVNAVSPGPIETGIMAKELPPAEVAQQVAAMTAAIPMQRFGRIEEVARAVVYLAFDATYTTGLELAVDGGGTQL